VELELKFRNAWDSPTKANPNTAGNQTAFVCL
jgi:hypothetical protein